MVSESDGKKNDNNTQAKLKKKQAKAKKPRFLVWLLMVLILTLTLSFSFSMASELIIASAPIIVAYIVIVSLIIISVIFDIVAVSITACDVEPFLAMAARKVKGARKAVYLTKHAEKVSSICGDIIGDVCAVITGACGTAIVALQVAGNAGIRATLLSVVFSSVLAAITVTGKAVGKQYSVSNANKVVFFVAKLLSVFEKGYNKK